MVTILYLALAHQQTFDITQYGARPGADDTAAIQRALDTAGRSGGVVRVPSGEFLVSNLTLPSRVTLKGIGAASVLRRAAGSSGRMISINPNGGGSADPTKNATDITISSLTLKDNAEGEGNAPHQHILNVNATSNLRIDNVRFVGYRGDGIYFGSDISSENERHNFDVTISHCTFDGVNKQNRNAISIIDGSRISIADCLFTRSSGRGPAPIDIEPNKQTHHWVQNISILRNTFEDNGAHANISSDIFFPQERLPKAFRAITIKDNVFKNSAGFAVQLYQQNAQPDAKVAPNEVVIDNNTITNLDGGIRLRGMGGVTISNNKITNCKDGIILGPTFLFVDSVKVLNNTFTDIGPSENENWEGAIVVRNARRITISGNTASGLRKSSGDAAPLVLLGQKGSSEAVDVESNRILPSGRVRGNSRVIEKGRGHNSGGAEPTVRGNSGG